MKDETEAAATSVAAPQVDASEVVSARPRWQTPTLQVMALSETQNGGVNPDGSISTGPVS